MKLPIRRDVLREDAVAGLVLGLQSVPDGLATGLLTGVSPLAGLYGYMVGTLAGAFATSSTFMAIQGTGAMAMIISDTPEVHGSADPARALFTLAVLTGVVMALAGLLRLGSILRFVSNAVMVAFINAVGVNIVLGQLANFTGYAADGPNRIVRALVTVTSPFQLDAASLVIGFATIGLIVALERTRLGALGLVVAVVLTSAAAALFGLGSVATLGGLGIDIGSLPAPQMPEVALVPVLIVPALSLAFVGLVQGAGISANFPNADGTYGDLSRDFLAQGVANVASGAFQGDARGRLSVSASALNREAGARSRQSLVITGLVIGLVIVALGGRRGPRRDAGARGPADAHRHPDHQARGPVVGLAHRPRPEGGPRGHLRADARHPAPVRRARGCRHVACAVRAPVEQARPAPADPRRGRPPPRGRAARAAGAA
ncbi:MAG: SulP family inorganic anion transporter [Chloroflexota bacterium]